MNTIITENDCVTNLVSQQTGSNIGERGAITLSEALKSNTTLTALNLSGQDETDT